MRLLLLLTAWTSISWGTTFYVTVAGLGGGADYEQRFSGWSQEIDQVLHQAGGDARVHTLAGETASKEILRLTLEGIARQATSADALAVMLIGHGTYDGYNYKFNLPGPDITGIELAGLLDRVPASRQMVANMTSASGASIAALRKPNRTVITATKSGTQRNAVVFARYWAAALQDAAADTDKNEVISALEAFDFANRKAQEFYTTQKRLATEHALLEDTGSGEGVREPSVQNGTGLQARQFALLRIGATQLAAQDPAKKPLLEQKESLESEIDRLKYEKAAMPLEEYREKLTELLLELARTQRELDSQ